MTKTKTPPPIEDDKLTQAEASFASRMACLLALGVVTSVWMKYAENMPPLEELHSFWTGPLLLTMLYLVSLPCLKFISSNYIKNPKSMLKEAMVAYNIGQVALNGWTVYYIFKALYNGHPFVGSVEATTCTFAVWVHYCDKYLEFFDTYFMVLRNRMDQVSFLHLYHHTTIAWAWWAGMYLSPHGDAYFGALLNSWIHVMMYSYYALTLMGVSCPWKKYLTQAQLIQFLSVIVYTGFSLYSNHKQGQLGQQHILACVIQVGEMVSLFVLFSNFYKKSYTAKKTATKGEEKKITITAAATTTGKPAPVQEYNDECSAAIKSTIEKFGYDEVQAAFLSFTQPVRTTGKVAIKEFDRVTRSGGNDTTPQKASSRPSWSFVGN